MNIFEQYGIKEVADCTLYAIERDKYDDEIYIPVLYFDTLKVSTLEQTAEQSFAQGGLGNAKLIGWDYGKEISVQLEDALYSPASQSLMWGGLFGTKRSKIWGVWNPCVYEKDRYGRTIYLKREVVSEEPTEDLEQWVEFQCPCDGSTKWVRYLPNDWYYKYYTGNTKQKVQTDQFTKESSAVEYRTDEKTYQLVDSDNAALFSDNGLNLIRQYTESQLKPRTSWYNNERPEVAQLILENFGKFDYKGLGIDLTDSTSAGSPSTASLRKIDICEKAITDGACNETPVYRKYEWTDCEIKMNSLEGNQDSYLLDSADVQYLVGIDSGEKIIRLSSKGLYESDISETNKKKVASEVLYYDESDTLVDDSTKLADYLYVIKPYQNKIDIYLNCKWVAPTESDGSDLHRVSRVKVGTFYIIKDWNVQSEAPEEMIYPINSGLEDVYYMDRMEKCKATQTFCIDADRNIRMSNYRYMPEYEQAELTVFIDPKTMKPYEPNTDHFHRRNGQVVEGNLRIIKQYEIYYKWTRSKAPEYTTLGHRVIVDAQHFPGTYKLVGETYARARKDGKDQRYQFEIPLCKMSSETSLTLQADGDPTTYTMNLTVLRREDGVMMKITQYDVKKSKFDGTCSDSTEIVPSDGVISTDPIIDDDGVD